MLFIGAAAAEKKLTWQWKMSVKSKWSTCQEEQYKKIQKTISGIPLPGLRALHPHFLPYSQLLNPIIYIPIASNRHRFETNSCCSRCSQLLCMSQVSSCGNQSLGPLAAQSVHVVKLSAGFLTSISIWYFFLAIDHDIIWPKSEGWFLAANWREKKNRRFTSRGESGWGIINSNLRLLSETYCKKRALFWFLGPTGSEECLLEYTETMDHYRSPTGTIDKLDGEHPPKLHQNNQKQKKTSALESFQSQQISSPLNMSTYGKRQALKLHEVQRRSRETRL